MSDDFPPLTQREQMLRDTAVSAQAEIERLRKLIQPEEWKGWEQVDSIYDEARLLRRERDEAREERDQARDRFGRLVAHLEAIEGGAALVQWAEADDDPEQIEAQKEVAGTRRCTNWQDSCHGDPEIDECVCERREVERLRLIGNLCRATGVDDASKVSSILGVVMTAQVAPDPATPS